MLVVAATALAYAAPVALVTDIVGAGTQKGGPLKLLAELPRGSEIGIGDGGRVVVFYLADGSEWTLAGRGRYRLGAAAPEALDGAPAPARKLAAAGLRAVKFRTDRATQGGLQMRGGGDLPLLRTPVDEVVLGGPVTFAWEPATAATTYRFELVDGAGASVYVLDTPESTLRLPADVALAPGHEYLWAVSGRVPDAAAPFYRAAAFRTADEATRRRLDAAQPAAGAAFSERVLYAALLEDAGAKSAARAQRAALAAERPAAWAPPR